MVRADSNQVLRDFLQAQAKDAVKGQVSGDMGACTPEVRAIECYDDDDDSSPLERTSAQAAARVQILGVLERLPERKRSAEDLQQRCAGALPAGETETQLDLLRKQARNLGEDLLEDLLGLDKLSGLLAEDRSSRKTAIAGIEELLENVDASKACLAALQKKIQVAQQADSQKHDQEEVLIDEAADAPHDDEPMPSLGFEGSSALEGLAEDQQALTPDSSHWKTLCLKVDFQSRREPNGYAIHAAVPGLKVEDLQVKLSDDQLTLSIEGICLPTKQQAEQLRQRLALHRPGEGLAALARRRFGRFSEHFRMPADVDTARISASLDGGVLRVTLPQRRRRDVRPMTARYPGGFQSSRLQGHPAFTWY